MQRALVRFDDDSYVEFVARDQHSYRHIWYDHSSSLLDNTECSPELIRLLNNNYAQWVLILRETDALLITYNASIGCILAFGEIAYIIDWVREVANREPSKVAYSPYYSYAALAYFFGVSPLLDQLHNLNCIPKLDGYETLHLAQTGNGTTYWGCFLPATDLQ